MTGVTQLRELYAEESRDISEPAEIIARVVVPAPARRRWIAPLAAAVAVAAVVAGVATAVAVIDARHRTTPVAGPTLQPMTGRELRYTVSVGDIPGYYTRSRYLLPQRETTYVQLSGGRGIVAGVVLVYPAGVYNPTVVRSGQPVTVHGRPGFFAKTASVINQDDGVPTKADDPTLAWATAQNQWIVIQGWNSTGTPDLEKRHLDPFTELMKVAAATRDGVSEPLRIPFAVGYLPKGLLPCGGSSDLWFGDPRQWKGAVTFAPEGTTCGQGLSIDAESYNPFASQFSIDGHRARYEPPAAHGGAGNGHRPAELDIAFGTATVTLFGDYSRAALIKIAGSITMASNVLDQSTWFDTTR
jgi:hypothetical protein